MGVALIRERLHPLLLASLMNGCAGPNYGPPTDHTEISAVLHGGLAGGPNGFSLVGTTVTYSEDGQSATAGISRDAVAKMLHALESVDFLDLDRFQTCDVGSDYGVLTVHAVVTEGSNEVDFVNGCPDDEHFDAFVSNLMGPSGYYGFVEDTN